MIIEDVSIDFENYSVVSDGRLHLLGRHVANGVKRFFNDVGLYRGV